MVCQERNPKKKYKQIKKGILRKIPAGMSEEFHEGVSEGIPEGINEERNFCRDRLGNQGRTPKKARKKNPKGLGMNQCGYPGRNSRRNAGKYP